MKKIWATVAMFLATIIWGVGFSAQSKGAESTDAMLFIMLRSAVGAAALILIIMAADLIREKKISIWGTARTVQEKRHLLAGGFWCGLCITSASVLQQCGVEYISAGKTGFLTALYIVIVPILGIFFKRKTSAILWAAVTLAMAGTWILCGGISGIGAGDWFVIGCAFFFSLHILVIDHYAEKCDCIRLSCLQFLAATVLSAGTSLLTGETWTRAGIFDALPYWLFCGLGSSAIAFTLQIVAQKYLHPVTATLLMSLESIFALLAGWLFLKEALSGKEILGCGIIFLAILLAQIPVPQTKEPARINEKT